MTRHTLLRLIAATAFFTGTSLRAETTSLELILDCSASMWNKLEDGRYRIDGAKQVLSEFLSTTRETPDVHIGLRIYGSKVAFGKPGACDDSVLVAPIEGFARSVMLAEVKAARAVGATPLAKSLELSKGDFTKPGVRRLVIFTDGEESCDGDVMAALASLKEAGIDVDVRIIGIGLGKDAARRFSEMGVPVENVNSVKKLADALGKAAGLEAEPPQIAALTVKLVKDGRPYAAESPKMTGSLNAAEVKLQPADEGTFKAEAAAGAYEITVGKRTFGNLAVHPKAPNDFVFDLTEAPQVKLRVEPSEGGTLGDEITVHFKGAKGLEREFITIVPEGSPDLAEPFWAYVEGLKEGSVKVRVQGAPGKYEARYIARIAGENVLAGRSAPFDVKLPQITLKVPDSVPASTDFTIEWSGPANESDWIGWVKAGADDGAYGNYGRPRKGEAKLTLLAPPEPGDYEIRYASDFNSQVLSRIPLKVVASEYAIDAAGSTMAGTTVTIGWTAPKSSGIYITIVPEGADPGSYSEYVYTKDAASPLKLDAPRTTGKHEIRINSENDGAVLFRRPITLTDIKATLDAPATGNAGAAIAVKWTGPNGKGDYVTITALDAGEDTYLQYFYTRDAGAEANLTLPETAGSYELRYVADGKVVARKPVTVQ